MDKILFFLTLFLIVIIIVINYNQVISPNEIKKLPWDKRSLYIKMNEIFNELYNKQNLTTKDLAKVEELMVISSTLKDFNKYKFAENLKFNLLIEELEKLNLTSIQKFGLYIIKNNPKKDEITKMLEGD
ncbi:hypothetical protein SU69_05095 [Thermosipho melanesiensis]|uniref:Uncharacterized protein n=2 Tax=Thermosipho melanesiensis TaxID=46541 RepID=A6LLQ5_THEM4|nr:hypothetical protein [Thermosipho melanesiensis]ABR30856.1 hypothetical protein Tmel_0995 [Thermosipho melanesiensis BI429]APT73975.1 hypothetical protein BW47_05330 [Thermosipho melanesiensis]OOC35909.1 hypothetical protein SU68_05150 [Thermosipho melanesiensis]OOC38411.1 hypothetical protein SU69_05095 [Thermosipho melanesiensis]OOC38872.1 hypothetical protein SU70_05095 [Thermosipho melanesiensis]